MDVKKQGKIIKSSDFMLNFNDPSLAYDDSTGLGNVEIKIKKGIKRFSFVKDDSTGITCCYYQPRPNANAIFVRKAQIKTVDGKDYLEIFDNTGATPLNDLEVSPKNANIVNVANNLIEITDDTKHPEIKNIYSSFATKTPVNMYEAELKISAIDMIKGKRDKDRVFFVCAAHPTKSGEKSIYMLTESQVSSGLAGKSSADLLAGGAKVVNKFRLDKNGNMYIQYYKEADRKALFSLKATDVNGGLRSWVESQDNRFVDKKVVSELTPFAKITTTVVAICTLGTIFIALPVLGNTGDFTEEAIQAGRVEMLNNINNIKEANKDFDLFATNSMGEVVQSDGVVQAMQEAIKTYKRVGQGFLQDYSFATRRGAAMQLGAEVVKELVENKAPFVTYNKETNLYEPKIYFPLASNVKSEVAMQDEGRMIEYLMSDEFNYTEEEAKILVDDYKKGYSEQFKQDMKEIGKLVPDYTSADIDFGSKDLKESIVYAINLMRDEDIELDQLQDMYFDIDSENKTAFIMVEDGLYQIDLGTEKIESENGLIQAINNSADIVTARDFDNYFAKGEKGKSYELLEKDLEKQLSKKVYGMFIREDNLKKDASGLYMQPKLVVVTQDSNNEMIIQEYNTNRVYINNQVEMSQDFAVKLSVLSNYGLRDVEGIYTVERSDDAVNTKTALTSNEGPVMGK